MKKSFYPCILILCLLLLQTSLSFSQFPISPRWSTFPSYTPDGRQGPVSFVIGNKAYVGTGSSTKEFWEFDPSNNSWDQKADFPGDGRLRTISFSIGTKGYIGTGQSTGNSTSADFWEYDPASNSWTQKASIPVGRRQAVGFSIGNKGYVGTGTTSVSGYSADFWEYDPSVNSWTQKANFPGDARRSAAGFSINDKGYIGTGRTETIIGVSDFWEYNPATNAWTQKADFGGQGRVQALAMASATKGYIGTGTGVSGYGQSDIWEYMPSTNTWSLHSTPGALVEGTGFSTNSTIYVGFGIGNPWFRQFVEYWEVRNTTGDYDEQIQYGYPTCFQYPMQYDGTWRGYIECPAGSTECYAGFGINTLQNLGKLCYRSRVDANATLRTGSGWFGGNTRENISFCRRNYQVTFENQPTSPVNFRLMYTKEEIDNLISSFNIANNTTKTYSDLLILKYSGINQDLDPSNNSNNNSDYVKIIPALTFYGNTNQYVFTEFSVNGYSEFYLALSTPQNKFYVNDNSLAGDVFTTAIGNNSNNGSAAAPFATPEYAYSIAQPGDTIYVDAGTYVTPNITIGKAITIRGTNYLNSPNNPADRLVLNSVRNADALITGSTFTIASNDVSLEGLAFNPGAKSQVTMATTGINNFSFKRNYSIVTSTFFLSLNGPSIPIGQASAFGNYLIEDNRFESRVTINSLCIIIGALNDVTVNNNTFFTPATSLQRLLTSCAPGNGGLTVNYIYSNNISNAARNELFSSGNIASARIENNISLNGQRSLLIQLSNSTSSDIQVRNNYIETNFAEVSPIQYFRIGTASPGALANLLIEDNTIIQNPAGRTSVPAAILAQAFFSGSIPSTTIRRNKISFNGDYSLFPSSSVLGINFTGSWQNITLEENEIAFNGTNLTNTIPASGPSSSGISISSDDQTFSIPANAVINIAGNKINGFRNSIAVYDASSLAPNTYVGYGNLAAGVALTINNNSFTGDEISINNGTVGQSVNASCNWYGSAEAEIIKPKISDNVNNGPWLVNGTDTDPVALGFQAVPGSCTGRQNKFYVNDNSQTGDVFTTAVGNNANNGFSTAPFATINYAISVALAGDTIIVDAGSYVENVIVNKSLTLHGVKYGQHPGASLDRIGETVIMPAVNNTALTGCVVRVDTDNITLDGFMIDGDNPAISGGVLVNGVDVNAGSGVFNNNVYLNNLTVINNIVKNTAAYGIGQTKNGTAPAATGALFRYNRVDNVASRGLVFNMNTYGSIMDNYVTRATNSGIWIANSTLAHPNGLPVIVSGNTVNATFIGMQSSVVNTAAPRIEFLNNDVTVGSSGYGISILSGGTGSTTGITGANNNISGGISSVLANAVSSTAFVSFNNNSFTGYSSKSFEIYNGLLINGSCNWFGTNLRTAIESSILGIVNYTPWLINGTDTDPATGFQPVANVCLGQPKYYVNDNSLIGDVFTTSIGNNANNGSLWSPFATLDYAYSIAQPGDTIYVDAGTYVMANLVINKAITILGTNYQVTPNNPADKKQVNAARNAEAIVTGSTISIRSSNISFEGFTFDPGDKFAFELFNNSTSNNDFGNFLYSKNILKIRTTTNNSQFSIIGKFVTSPALPVTSGYNIADNRFEKISTATGSTLQFSYVKNITVTDNSFVSPGSILRSQQTVLLGATGIVDAFIFSNNTIEDAPTVIGGNRIAGAIITGNKMHNINNPISNTNSMPESSNIEFSNNELGNDLGTPFMLYNRTGVSLAGTSNVFKVENNIITGVSVAAVNQLFASMNLTFSNSVLSPSFIIRGNKITYSGDFSSVGSQFFRPITVRGNIANVMLENNELTLNNAGGLGEVNPGTFLPINPAFSIITDNGATSYMPSNAVINVLNNKIHGFKETVVFYDVAAAGHNSYVGYGNIPAGATINVNNNSFTGDSISINSGTVGQTVNANCNWYGSAAAQNVLPKVTALTVNYIPWLTNGTDNDPATGFQPVPGSCNGTIPSVSFDASSNVSCFNGNNGTISITVSGGSAAYNFNWSRNGTAGYSMVEDPANLTAGTYDLIMTDANGSTASLNGIVITEPTLLSATATGVSTSCVNSASVSAGGGTGTYSYLWSNGATTSSINNIPSGTYSVTVTDQNGCTVIATCTVTGNPAFNPSISVSNVSCFGEADGSLTVTNVNGVAPYQYSKDGLIFQLSNVFNGLIAGTYTITVRDALGCTGFNTKTVEQPSQLVITLNSVQSTCFGVSTGSISTSASGGSPAMNYSWTGPNNFSASNSNISNLATGNYTLTVTDSKGCTAVLQVFVPTAPQIVMNSVVSHIFCKGETNGSIINTLSGGSGAGFSYLWNSGATTKDRTNLGTGNYTLTVTDNGSGCSVSSTFTITQPATAVNLSTSKTNATGCNSLGAITVSGSGGTPPYQYSINGTTFVNSGSFTGLYESTYTVWVKDLNGCTKSAAVLITDNGSDEYENNNSKNQAKSIVIGSPINARIAIATDQDWFKFTTPAASNNYMLTLNHSSMAFTFDLLLANGTTIVSPTSITSTTKNYTLPGNLTYYIRITGSASVNSFICYELLLSTPGLLTRGSGENIITIPEDVPEVLKAISYPNPHNGSFNIKISSPEEGTGSVTLFTATGQNLSERKINLQKGENNIIPYSGIIKGTIFYRIQIGSHFANGKIIGLE